VREYARDLNVLTLCIWSLYDPDDLLGGEISMRSNLLLDVMLMGDVDDIRLERRIEHHRNRLRNPCSLHPSSVSDYSTRFS
jgi:hypothetical protein